MAADTQVLLVGGGAVAIGGALIWRILARHVEVSRLVRRLRKDTQAVQRARGGNALVDLGLRRAAKPILRAMDTEPDPRVRRSVALAIARRQWEPSGPARVGRVRQWASEELNRQGQRTQEFGPAVTRLSDMGGPRLTGPNGNGGAAAPPTTPAPEPALAPTLPTLRLAPEPVPPPAAVDAPAPEPVLEPEPSLPPDPAAAPAPAPRPVPQAVPHSSPSSTPGHWAIDRSAPAPDPGPAPAPVPEPTADPAPSRPEPATARPGSTKQPGWWADPESES